MTTDERAVELIAQGSPVGMELLYDRYGRIAYALAYRILGESEAAEDVVQDAFISAWRGAASYRRERGNQTHCQERRNQRRGTARRLPVDTLVQDRYQPALELRAK